MIIITEQLKAYSNNLLNGTLGTRRTSLTQVHGIRGTPGPHRPFCMRWYCIRMSTSSALSRVISFFKSAHSTTNCALMLAANSSMSSRCFCLMWSNIAASFCVKASSVAGSRPKAKAKGKAISDKTVRAERTGRLTPRCRAVLGLRRLRKIDRHERVLLGDRLLLEHLHNVGCTPLLRDQNFLTAIDDEVASLIERTLLESIKLCF